MKSQQTPPYQKCKTNKEFCSEYMELSCPEICDYALYLEGVLTSDSLDSKVIKIIQDNNPMGEY